MFWLGVLEVTVLVGVIVLLAKQGTIAGLVRANHAEVEALHADVLKVTGQRDAARNVSEDALDTVDAAVNELRAEQGLHVDHGP